MAWVPVKDSKIVLASGERGERGERVAEGSGPCDKG